MSSTSRAPSSALPPEADPFGSCGPRTVARFMTTSPHSVGLDQTLDVAGAMMRKHNIRHLPVLDGGKLAGILSQRDLYFLQSMPGSEASKVRVEEAMSQDTFCVRPDAPIDEVALEMADHKYGCVVVMEGAKVVGVFTTTDALRAIAGLRGKQPRGARKPAPKAR